METQLMMWPVLTAEPAPRDCDARNDQVEGRGVFALEPPAVVPESGTAESLEREAARAREVMARKEGQK